MTRRPAARNAPWQTLAGGGSSGRGSAAGAATCRKRGRRSPRDHSRRSPREHDARVSAVQTHQFTVLNFCGAAGRFTGFLRSKMMPSRSFSVTVVTVWPLLVTGSCVPLSFT